MGAGPSYYVAPGTPAAADAYARANFGAPVASNSGENIARWIIWVVILIAAVLALIFAALAWSEVNHTDEDSDCHDGNHCTVDTSYDNGACSHEPKKNGHSCDNICLQGGQGSCNQMAQCTGDCAGQCATSDGSDCPVVFLDNTAIAAPHGCFYNSCIYTSDVFIVESIFDAVFSCTDQQKILDKYCFGSIGDAVNPYKSCLIVDTACESNNSGNFTEILITCQFAFQCATPLFTAFII